MTLCTHLVTSLSWASLSSLSLILLWSSSQKDPMFTSSGPLSAWSTAKLWNMAPSTAEGWEWVILVICSTSSCFKKCTSFIKSSERDSRGQNQTFQVTDYHLQGIKWKLTLYFHLVDYQYQIHNDLICLTVSIYTLCIPVLISHHDTWIFQIWTKVQVMN